MPQNHDLCFMPLSGVRGSYGQTTSVPFFTGALVNFHKSVLVHKFMLNANAFYIENDANEWSLEMDF